MTKFLVAHFIDNFCYDDNLSINSYHFKIILEYNYFSLHFFVFYNFFEMLTVKRMTRLAIIADVLNYVLYIMFIIIISWKVTIL